jgi:hypothetical protein
MLDNLYIYNINYTKLIKLIFNINYLLLLKMLIIQFIVILK